MRPDAARPRAHPRGLRGPASRHVPHAGRLSAEHRRRAGIAPRRRRRGDGDRRRFVTRGIYIGPWRVDLTVRDGVTSPVSAAALARSVAAALDAAVAAGRAPSPASIGLNLSDDAELAELNGA